MVTVSILVSGKVQGVFYRQTSREIAREIGVTGEVSNLPDGNVLIIATGTQPQINELVAWCKKGPDKAIVDHVEVTEHAHRSFNDFRVLRS